MDAHAVGKFLPLLAAMLLAACTQTQYVAYDDNKNEVNPFSRTVEFDLSRKFYRDPPECAVVLPFTVEGKRHPYASVIEESLARHLTAKMSRVIGPAERHGLTRNLAVDLSHPGDRKVFARSTRCRGFIEAKPWGGESIYAVFWTQSRIGLDVSIGLADDDAVVWRARHVATRSDGGFPLSPFSAAFSLFEATRLSTDGDVSFSLVDDAVRRIVKTLPDTRFPVAALRRGKVTPPE